MTIKKEVKKNVWRIGGEARSEGVSTRFNKKRERLFILQGMYPHGLHAIQIIVKKYEKNDNIDQCVIYKFTNMQV